MNETAAELRDEGIEGALASNREWKDFAWDYFVRWVATKPVGYLFVAEDFKRDAINAGIGHPYHHNAWGGLFSHINRRNLIINTGRSTQAKSPKSHARRSCIYAVTNGSKL